MLRAHPGPASPANGFAAAAAGLALAAIDPQAVPGSDVVRGAALLAAISHDHIAGILKHVRRDQLFAPS